MIPFIDVSSNNQHDGIDWPTVAKYLTSLHPEAGVVVKVNQGLDYVNPFLHQQRMGAHAAGIRNVGLYDYVTPSANAGHTEAAAFLAAIGNDGGILTGEFLAMDNEDPNVPDGADLYGFCIDWLEPVWRALGLRSFHYSAHYYLAPHNLERDPKLADYPLWYASYQNTLPPTPTPWTKITMWQYTSQGQVPGIQGVVDLNWFEGEIADLRPYQWGFQVDPLAGQIVAGKPDIAVDGKGQATDINKAVQQIAANLARARGMMGRGTTLDDLLAVTQGDAAAVALVSGLLS